MLSGPVSKLEEDTCHVLGSAWAWEGLGQQHSPCFYHTLQSYPVGGNSPPDRSPSTGFVTIPHFPFCICYTHQHTSPPCYGDSICSGEQKKKTLIQNTEDLDKRNSTSTSHVPGYLQLCRCSDSWV